MEGLEFLRDQFICSPSCSCGRDIILHGKRSVAWFVELASRQAGRQAAEREGERSNYPVKLPDKRTQPASQPASQSVSQSVKKEKDEGF